MRRLLIIMIACCSLQLKGQTIGSFLGVYLGQSRSEVTQIITQKYTNYKWENYNELKVTGVNIAGIKFQSGYFYFSNNTLHRARFMNTYCSPPIGAIPISECLKFASNEAQELISAFIYKYGEASLVTDNSIIWRQGNKTIKLLLEGSEDLCMYRYILSYSIENNDY